MLYIDATPFKVVYYASISIPNGTTKAEDVFGDITQYNIIE